MRWTKSAVFAVGLIVELPAVGHGAIQLEKRKAAWSALQQRVNALLRDFHGEAGLVIVDLDRGWRFTHQAERLFPAASVIKIGIMAGYFQAVKDARIKWNTPLKLKASDKAAGSGSLKAASAGSSYSVEVLNRLMISESDNTATNMLIDRLGMDYFNRYFQKVGMRQTNLSRKMMDFTARSKGVENFTTASDTELLLARLYRKELVTAALSRQGLEWLKQQKSRNRIPAKLPKKTVVAHKTGLENFICHDAGIVYTPKGDFLITVLVSHKNPTAQKAKALIAAVALEAYQYMVQ